MLTKRIVYLVLLWVIAAEFFNLWFYGYLDQNIKLLVLFLYSFLGAFFFRRHKWVDFRDDLIQLKLLIAGLFFSMLMASLFYNQSLLTSLVAYRFQYACLCFVHRLEFRYIIWGIITNQTIAKYVTPYIGWSFKKKIRISSIPGIIIIF